MFENLSFDEESDILDKLKTGSFIESSSPANFTIRDSFFKMHHREMEDFDVFKFEDSELCAPNDEITQYISFIDNTVTFNDVQNGVFNNFYMSYTGSNQRYKEILVQDNLFYNMIGSVKVFIQIKNPSPGIITVEDNTIQNCSSATSLLTLQAQDEIKIKNVKFDTIEAFTKGLISTSDSKLVTISNIEITNITHTSNLLADSLIKIGTQDLGRCVFEYSYLHDNNVKANVIEFESSVGSVEFSHNTFLDDVIQSFNNYIKFENLYELLMTNCSFSGVTEDGSNDRLTLLFNINNLNLAEEGSYIFRDLTLYNISLSVFTLSNIVGTTETPKLFEFNDIMFTDSTFNTRNNLITFGPLITDQDIQISMKYLTFRDIYMYKTGNLIQFSIQMPNPIIIDSCIFENNFGALINLVTTSTAEGISPVNVQMTNVTVSNCDFMFSTFFVLRAYSTLTVTNCTMRRNSAYFRGVIASILGSDSSATFTDCNFNNNNGILGGLFYVSRISYIEVINSNIFSNFAVTASMAYVGNQGKIIIDSCDISRNQVISVGLLEIVDSIAENEFSNNNVYSNEIILATTTIRELDNPII